MSKILSNISMFVYSAGKWIRNKVLQPALDWLSDTIPKALYVVMFIPALVLYFLSGLMGVDCEPYGWDE